jgi:hypothetical protein
MGFWQSIGNWLAAPGIAWAEAAGDPGINTNGDENSASPQWFQDAENSVQSVLPSVSELWAGVIVLVVILALVAYILHEVE